MQKIDLKKYEKYVKAAIRYFWKTRDDQKSNQATRNIHDTGNRSSVTGGKQMNGFLELLVRVAKETGIPEKYIYVRANQLPGYFRPTKDWDMIIMSPKGKLISVLELKSQVGSFGNNFNNRTEEALGSALDLWTAFREKAYLSQRPPWLGYLLVVERSDQSIRPVKVLEPYFKVMKEFQGTSYMDRYKLFCQKLMLERHYSQTCLIWSSSNGKYGNVEDSISIESFLHSFIGHLTGHLHEFK